MNAKRFQLLMVFFVVFPAITIGVLAATGSFKVHDLRVYGEIPEFELKGSNGKLITKEDLLGKVWVSTFVFTHCTGQCPLIVFEAQRIQKALHLKENFRMLSISVDPERDTPDELAAYAKKVGADPYKWFFATGSKEDIQAFIQNGFRLTAMDDGGDAGQDILHSSKVVLVDHRGKIRGYYDANESAEMRAIIKDAKTLLRQVY